MLALEGGKTQGEIEGQGEWLTTTEQDIYRFHINFAILMMNHGGFYLEDFDWKRDVRYKEVKERRHDKFNMYHVIVEADNTKYRYTFYIPITRYTAILSPVGIITNKLNSQDLGTAGIYDRRNMEEFIGKYRDYLHPLFRKDEFSTKYDLVNKANSVAEMLPGYIAKKKENPFNINEPIDTLLVKPTRGESEKVYKLAILMTDGEVRVYGSDRLEYDVVGGAEYYGVSHSTLHRSIGAHTPAPDLPQYTFEVTVNQVRADRV